jgi:hypothetical protein
MNQPERDGKKRRLPEEPAEPGSPAPTGKADTPYVAGPDEHQPELAARPVSGLQPGESTGNPDRWRPPLEVDPPTGPDIPRDAAGDTEARRRQKKQGGP